MPAERKRASRESARSVKSLSDQEADQEYNHPDVQSYQLSKRIRLVIDPRANAGYLFLRPGEIERTRAEDSSLLDSNQRADYNRRGTLVGIELLNIQEGVNFDDRWRIGRRVQREVHRLVRAYSQQPT